MMLIYDIEKLIADPNKPTKDFAYIKDMHNQFVQIAKDINQRLSDGDNKEEAIKALSTCLHHIKQGLQE